MYTSSVMQEIAYFEEQISKYFKMSSDITVTKMYISRAMVFRDYAKNKKVTGADYDKKTSTWNL